MLGISNAKPLVSSNLPQTMLKMRPPYGPRLQIPHSLMFVFVIDRRHKARLTKYRSSNSLDSRTSAGWLVMPFTATASLTASE
jgi:hypothetical protein